MKLKKTKKALIKHLERIFDHLYDPFRNSEDIGSGEWLGMLFQCEALRGCIQAIRAGKSLKESIWNGHVTASRSIYVWNRKDRRRARKTEILVGEFFEGKIEKYKKRSR